MKTTQVALILRSCFMETCFWWVGNLVNGSLVNGLQTTNLWRSGHSAHWCFHTLTLANCLSHTDYLAFWPVSFTWVWHALIHSYVHWAGCIYLFYLPSVCQPWACNLCLKLFYTWPTDWDFKNALCYCSRTESIIIIPDSYGLEAESLL